MNRMILRVVERISAPLGWPPTRTELVLTKAGAEAAAMFG